MDNRTYTYNVQVYDQRKVLCNFNKTLTFMTWIYGNHFVYLLCIKNERYDEH